MGQDEDNLIGKTKDVHTSKVKLGIHLLHLISRQIFSHFHENRAHHVKKKKKTGNISVSFCPHFVLA